MGIFYSQKTWSWILQSHSLWSLITDLCSSRVRKSMSESLKMRPGVLVTLFIFCLEFEGFFTSTQERSEFRYIGQWSFISYKTLRSLIVKIYPFNPFLSNSFHQSLSLLFVLVSATIFFVWKVNELESRWGNISSFEKHVVFLAHTWCTNLLYWPETVWKDKPGLNVFYMLLLVLTFTRYAYHTSTQTHSRVLHQSWTLRELRISL